ncbi:MAG: hypothetical protein KGP28_00310 [Bdellovibrionales bacterium]|nr:hypothetical protein [Bdellovibrionales bacterium]
MMEKLFWPAINLFGLLGFLAYKTKAPFFDFVSGRRKEIFVGLNKSKAQFEEAERRRAEAESKLELLGVETRQIESEWSQKSVLQAETIRQSSARVIAQMKIEAEQNRLALIEQIRGSIRTTFRKAILSSAEQKILQALTPEDHVKINARIVGQILRGDGPA